MTLYIAIDPGQTGGVAIQDDDKATLKQWSTPREMAQYISDAVFGYPGLVTCVIEDVHAMPGQGVSSAFKFGVNYGQWQGILQALNVPFARVSPVVWKRQMGLYGKKKDRQANLAAKRLAEERLGIVVKRELADAACLLVWARERIEKE